jgi:hypothetical protein
MRVEPVALGAAVVIAAWYATARGRQLGLTRRPLLAAMFFLAVASVALCLATLVTPSFDWPVRFGRPLATLLGLGGALFVSDRLLAPGLRLGRVRRALVDATLPGAALCAALAVAEVESGVAAAGQGETSPVGVRRWRMRPCAATGGGDGESKAPDRGGRGRRAAAHGAQRGEDAPLSGCRRDTGVGGRPPQVPVSGPPPAAAAAQHGASAPGHINPGKNKRRTQPSRLVAP